MWVSLPLQNAAYRPPYSACIPKPHRPPDNRYWTGCGRGAQLISMSGDNKLLLALGMVSVNWEVLDKSAKVEWNYLSQRRPDEVMQRLKQVAT